MRRIILSLFVFTSAAALWAAENRVLIVKEDTNYKKALVREVVEKLDDGNTEVEVIDHRRGQLDNVDPGDYDAIFITNSGVQAKVRPAVLAWLREVRDRDDNVIIHTTQINDWTPPVEVDSITSASQRSNIDSLSDDIVRRIRLFY